MVSNESQQLPNLPVPNLSDTLAKYLRSVRPLLSDEEYCTTSTLVHEFQCDEVTKTLQNYLKQRAASTDNWLAEWEVNELYLGYRLPNVIFSSPGQLLPLQEFKNDTDRLSYTAKLILAAANYIILLQNKKIPVEKKGGRDLDMDQYFKIFGTIRVPRPEVDDIQYYPDSEHIVVVHKNHYFKLQLFLNGCPLSEKQIYQQLDCIVKKSTIKAPPIGILSADHRDLWAQAYVHLAELNSSSVKDINESLFLVCLDDAMSLKNYPNLETEGFLQFIHGGGISENTGNRWFDKTLQFIIGCDGIVGLNYEHSPSEGQPIAVIIDYLVEFMNACNVEDIPDNNNVVTAKELHFQLNDDILLNIESSGKNIAKLASNFEFIYLKFDKYGKEFIKTQNLSPDSYIQMAVQLALYRMYRSPCPQRETVSTRMYVGGRTEAVRSCSIESVEFARCMLDDCASDTTKTMALRTAVNEHKKSVNEVENAEMGFGVDRHLLGLKFAAKDLGYQLHEFFTDLGYIRSAHSTISTIQVASKFDVMMAFGPKLDDAYGLCYNPRKNDINFGLSAWANSSHTDIKQLKESLVQSLNEMQSLLSKNQNGIMYT
ncbi:hypothetical protein FQR65_LT11415 [Abscondita terminalis]|nr:hypothetical protein FQR65_LT11415 [Abscondita terminalis]